MGIVKYNKNLKRAPSLGEREENCQFLVSVLLCKFSMLGAAKVQRF